MSKSKCQTKPKAQNQNFVILILDLICHLKFDIEIFYLPINHF